MQSDLQAVEWACALPDLSIEEPVRLRQSEAQELVDLRGLPH